MPVSQEKPIQTEEISLSQAEYEQSLVVYPEMPPMEQSQ